MATILTVDDEPGIRAFLADTLAEDGHVVMQAADAGEALVLLEEQPFDLAIIDLRMPGELGGMDVLHYARANRPAMQVIVLTAYGSVPEAVEAMRLGAFDFLEKPLDGPAALRRLVRRALNWKGAPRQYVPEPALVEEPRRGGLSHLLWQLQKRHVYQVAATYAAVGFILLQATELVLPAVPSLPGWVYPALVGVVLGGFPVALVLGWVYDITSTGLRRTRPESLEGS